jgi:hypothetical protein
MYQDEIDICMACIKAMPRYLDGINERLDRILIQLKWLFSIVCLAIVAIVLVHVV